MKKLEEIEDRLCDDDIHMLFDLATVDLNSKFYKVQVTVLQFKELHYV